MSDEATLRRLRWRCRRGMRELDQLLERYLDRRWPQAELSERARAMEVVLGDEADNAVTVVGEGIHVERGQRRRCQQRGATGGRPS